jgi:xanthine dehydrogenase accessory factor
MKEILADVERWRAKGEKVAIATVVATRRSAPRPVGAKLAVSESGELAGSVSGGCVEGDVFEHACEVLRSGQPKLLSYGIEDEEAWNVGLPCGGEIDVFVEPLDDRMSRVVTDRLLKAIEGNERAVVFTVIEGEPLGAKALALESGEVVGDGVPPAALEQANELIRAARNRLLELDDARVFAEVYGPPPRLVIIGAVDTADALCQAAKLLGWETIVVDARAKFATRERIPNADRLIVEWPEEALAEVQPDHATAVLVLTHDAKFDIPALKAALATDAFYIGALGSRRNQERRREKLLAEGVDAVEFERISGPCGLDVGADSQPETALSILAEIVALRAGRSGGRLRDSKQRIHAEAV